MKNIIPFGAILLLTACSQPQKQETFPIAGNWIEVVPSDNMFFQGMTLNEDGSAKSIGMETLLYEKWSSNDGKLILSGKSIGNSQTINFSDTLDILKHTADTLIVGDMTSQITYIRSDSIQIEPQNEVNILDSLQYIEKYGKVVTETYRGTVPAASCPGIEYTITIHHQKENKDGVFHAILKYLGSDNGQDQSFDVYGWQYTIKDKEPDNESSIIQLISFRGDDIMNFMKTKEKLIMLDQEMNKLESENNYILERTDSE